MFSRRGINPLIPLCCLGIILFLIASTIVIALIPVYLAVRGSAVNLREYYLHITVINTTDIHDRNGAIQCSLSNQ